MTIDYKTIAAAVAFSTILPLSAHAAVFDATSAVGSGADHSLWIKGGIGGGLGSDFDFLPAGTFDTDAGTLTGSVFSQSAGFGDTGFDISFTYGPFPDGFTGPSFKSENGSAPGSDIQYTYVTGGTLTGFGALAGLILGIEAMPLLGPFAVQYGSAPDEFTVGPNNKNSNVGMAHWFGITTIGGDCTTDYCEIYGDDISRLEGRQGDINVDLSAVPLPAGAWLLLSGFGAGALLRRKQKKAA
ncbi:MAG: VPLPA-CTERM sorting domain-containing protein [Pseudomonadota bacterium]